MWARTEEFAELDDSSMSEASFLSQECLVILVQVFGGDPCLVGALHGLEGRFSCQAFRYLKIESNKRRCRQIELDRGALQKLCKPVLAKMLQSST